MGYKKEYEPEKNSKKEFKGKDDFCCQRFVCKGFKFCFFQPSLGWDLEEHIASFFLRL